MMMRSTGNITNFVQLSGSVRGGFTVIEGKSFFTGTRTYPDHSSIEQGFITTSSQKSITPDEEAFIRANYTIVPPRTVDDLLRAHEVDIRRRPRREYVDIDVPMMDDGDD